MTEIATNLPLAVQRMKQGLREALDPDWNDLGRWVTVSLAELFGTEDQCEAWPRSSRSAQPHYQGK